MSRLITFNELRQIKAQLPEAVCTELLRIKKLMLNSSNFLEVMIQKQSSVGFHIEQGTKRWPVKLIHHILDKHYD